MKKILILTDFSDNAWNSVVYAINLYRDIPCEFSIFHAYDLHAIRLAATVSSQQIGYAYESINSESEKGLEMILEDIENTKITPLHTFKTILKRGNLLNNLKHILSIEKYDLIVMGMKGMTSAATIFIGSNTQRVLKKISSCPILVIPEDAYFQTISNIAFATDFKRIYYKSEIKPILDLAKITDPTIRMIHVYDEPKLSGKQQYNSNTLEKHFKNVTYDFHVIPEFSTIEKGILAFIEELEIDLLAMINYKHSFIERLTREPVIKKMVFHTEIPLLIIPADS
ncbi:hypothetical protein AB832_03735 [Flavobacteriaceae bacterium (ex Bugula neritina AB1)]|nr:hypothetical protein AB832_03735 [Flavobacteriaceae bacterium (ex Bugula neritina AB1)]